MLGNKKHVKKGDTVAVITGKDKTKTGKVMKLVPKKDGVVVEGLNMVKRHMKARANQPGGIVEKEAPIHISNVLLYCQACSKGVRTKVKVLEDNKKIRVCVKCGESFDN